MAITAGMVKELREMTGAGLATSSPKTTEPRIQIAITAKTTNTPTIQSWQLQTDGSKTTSIVLALTTDTSVLRTTAYIVPMPTIKPSISPICSHNTLCSTEVIQTIHILVYGSRWRTI